MSTIPREGYSCTSLTRISRFSSYPREVWLKITILTIKLNFFHFLSAYAFYKKVSQDNSVSLKLVEL